MYSSLNTAHLYSPSSLSLYSSLNAGHLYSPSSLYIYSSLNTAHLYSPNSLSIYIAALIQPTSTHLALPSPSRPLPSLSDHFDALILESMVPIGLLLAAKAFSKLSKYKRQKKGQKHRVLSAWLTVMVSE